MLLEQEGGTHDDDFGTAREGQDEYEHAKELDRLRQAKRRARAVALLAHGPSDELGLADDSQHDLQSPARPAPLEEGPDAMTDGMEDRRTMVAPKGDMFAEATNWTMQDALEVPYSPRDERQSHHGVLTWVVEGAAGVLASSENRSLRARSLSSAVLEQPRTQVEPKTLVEVADHASNPSPNQKPRASRPAGVPALDLSAVLVEASRPAREEEDGERLEPGSMAAEVGP